MASAEVLKVTYSTDDRVRGVDGKVNDVCDDVHDVGNKVKGVDYRYPALRHCAVEPARIFRLERLHDARVITEAGCVR